MLSPRQHSKPDVLLRVRGIEVNINNLSESPMSVEQLISILNEVAKEHPQRRVHFQIDFV